MANVNDIIWCSEWTTTKFYSILYYCLSSSKHKDEGHEPHRVLSESRFDKTNQIVSPTGGNDSITSLHYNLDIEKPKFKVRIVEEKSTPGIFSVAILIEENYVPSYMPQYYKILSLKLRQNTPNYTHYNRRVEQAKSFSFDLRNNFLFTINQWVNIANFKIMCNANNIFHGNSINICNLDGEERFISICNGISVIFELTVSMELDIPIIKALKSDLRALLSTGKHSDSIIKSSDGMKVNVHKAMLSARSAVFRAQFEHLTKESGTLVVDFPFTGEVLMEVLNFIYLDQVLKPDEMSEKLLPAADYFQLRKLKFICESALSKIITLEIAVDILRLSENHSALNLKKFTLDYMKNKKLKKVIATQSWQQVDDSKLIKLVCEHCEGVPFEFKDGHYDESENMQINLKILLNEGLHSDVVMKSNDGIEFKVHKAILAARSPVLKAHFEHDTNINAIESQFSGAVLQVLLNYLYTGDLNYDMAESVLPAADYYGLVVLLKTCESHIVKNLTPANAVDILQLADFYSLSELQNKTLDFIGCANTKDILCSSGWQQLKDVKLLKLLCLTISSKVD